MRIEQADLIKDAFKERLRKSLAPLLEAAEARKSAGDPEPNLVSGGDEEDELSLCRYLRGAVWGNWTQAAKEQLVYAKAQKAMSELTGAAGGFIVPPVILKKVIELLRAKAIVRQMGVTVISNLASNTLELPKQTGGASGYWVREHQEKPESQPTLGMIELVLKEVAALVIVPNTLLEDSTPTADTLVKTDIAEALALSEDTAIITGTGGVMPLGLLNWPGIPTSVFNVANYYDSLLDAMTAIEVANGTYNGWLTHPSAKNVLRKIKDTTGRYIWIASVDKTEPDTLFGMPVRYGTQFPPATLILGNWKELIIVEKRTGIVMDVSKEAGEAFRRNQTYFRGVKRVDSGVRHEECFHVITGVR